MRRPLVLVLLLLGGCATARPDLRDPWHVAAIGAGAADLGTTHAALQSPGVTEANPIGKLCGDSPGAVVACGAAIKVAGLALTAYVEHALELKGWHKRILWMLPVGMWGGAAIWNLQF